YDHQHVAVVTDVGSVPDPSMTGNDHRPALCHELGDAHPDQLVQCVYFAIDAAALVHVDRRIDIAVVNVTGSDGVRAAEPDHAVAVGHRAGHVKDLNRLVIEEPVQRVGVGQVRIGRDEKIRGFRFDHPAL